MRTDNRPHKELRTIKIGTVRDDGRVFAGYHPTAYKGERWADAEAFSKTKANKTVKVRRAPRDYDAGTIQHSCGVRAPTFAQQTKGVDAGFNAFFARKGRKKPYISSYELGHLSVEAQELIESY